MFLCVILAARKDVRSQAKPIIQPTVNLAKLTKWQPQDPQAPHFDEKDYEVAKSVVLKVR